MGQLVWRSKARLLALVLVCLAGMWASAATPVPGSGSVEVRAQQLRLVDPQGRVRGYFGAVGPAQQNTLLELLDGQGRARIHILFDSARDEAIIRVLDRNGVVTAEIPRAGGPSTRLRHVSEGGRKADDATAQNVRNLQLQIDELRAAVNSIVDQVNASR